MSDNWDASYQEAGSYYGNPDASTATQFADDSVYAYHSDGNLEQAASLPDCQDARPHTVDMFLQDVSTFDALRAGMSAGPADVATRCRKMQDLIDQLNNRFNLDPSNYARYGGAAQAEAEGEGQAAEGDDGTADDGYQVGDGYQVDDDYLADDGYQVDDGYQADDGYQVDDGYQADAGYQVDDGYLQDDGHHDSYGRH